MKFNIKAMGMLTLKMGEVEGLEKGERSSKNWLSEMGEKDHRNELFEVWLGRWGRRHVLSWALDFYATQPLVNIS